MVAVLVGGHPDIPLELWAAAGLVVGLFVYLLARVYERRHDWLR